MYVSRSEGKGLVEGAKGFDSTVKRFKSCVRALSWIGEELVYELVDEIENIVVFISLIIDSISRATLEQEARVRLALYGSAVSMLREVALVEEKAPPAMDFNVVENEASAGVRLAASDDSRRQQGSVCVYVTEGDVLDVHQWLCLTWHKWIKQATRIVMMAWLILLLRPNVNGPPKRLHDFEILVDDVSDLTTRARRIRASTSSLCFDVNCLEWVVECAVAESHIVNTAVFVFRWHRSHRKANTVPDVQVTHSHVLCAVDQRVVPITWLDCYGVVEVCNVESLNQNISTMGVYAIGVKREHWQGHVVQRRYAIHRCITAKEQLA